MLNDLTPKKNQVVFGDDSVVIQKYISGIKGGRTLDVTEVYEKVIKAGHLIIKNVETGVYKACPVATDIFRQPAESWKYVGVLYRSIPVSNPAASIMTMGEVNEAAMPFQFAEGAKEAFLKDCPHIVFIKDEEA